MGLTNVQNTVAQAFSEKNRAKLPQESWEQMNPFMNQWGPVAVIVAGYLLGIYFQSRSISHLDRRIDDLRDSINKRFDDLHDLLKSEIKRVEERIGHLATRMERVEQRLDRIDERLARLDNPIVRQS
jgi:Tfp pilus assembly protein PilN